MKRKQDVQARKLSTKCRSLRPLHKVHFPLAVELLEDRTLPSSSSIPAIALLDPASSGALTVTGNGTVAASGGGSVVVDSANSHAAVLTGNGIASAAEFDISGTPGYVLSGAAKLQGVIHSGAAASADPLAGLPVPQVPSTTYAAVHYSGAGTLTLSPGAYVGGISVSGKGSVTLLPGIYYLEGGGFSVTGQGGVTGNGVMIYNAPRSAGDAINFTGKGNVLLTPPTTGTYQDISVFQDRTSSAPISLTGNGSVNVTGTIYAARATLNISGNGGAAAAAALGAINEDILYDLNVSGNGGLAADATYNQPLTTLTVRVSAGPGALQGIVAGTTKPGASVDLETGSDGLFDEGHTTADASGNYSLSVTLATGLNVLRVRATSRFDQQMIASTSVTPPAFHLAAGTLDASTNTTSAAHVTLVGQTDPGATLTLVGTTLTALASSTGAFEIPGVSLAVGVNTLTVLAVNQAGNTSSDSLTVTRSSAVPSQPNAVIVWNQATLNAIQTDGTDPVMASRALAMVQAAVYDAVNNVEGTPAYYIKVTAPADASIDAAVDAAAHDVLGYLYPAQQATFDALLASQLALLPAGQGTTDGATVGQAVGNAIIALRANDGAKGFVAFTPGTAPGNWQPTAPMYAPALDPQAATMMPWALTSASQFDPAGPPALNSQQWAAAVNQVESLGAVNSTTRTSAQTTLAQFWNDGLGTQTPSGHWNVIAQTVAQQEANSLADDARLFAELDVSMADAGIATWNTKYLYDTWRPITVIQSGGDGVNPGVTADPTWTSLLTNPNFPEYVSGHSAYSMAAATVLDSFFGDSVTFTTTEPTTSLALTYTSFQQAAHDAGLSRLYGGIHFQFSIQDGWTVGQEVANWDLATFNVSQDTTPPKVQLHNVLASGASNTNVTITGQATDNLSGVAQLKVQVDGGAYAPLSFDPTTGNFSFTTTFALNGSADGKHTVNFQATDAAGNVAAPLPFAFTLATKAPTLVVTSPSGTLAPGATLTGTVTSEAPLVNLDYAFDGSTTMVPVAFNASAFSQALDLSKLAAGPHTLVVTAQDTAGNTTTKTLNLTLSAAIPLTVTSITPAAGSSAVSVTFRPEVFFSRPINTTTLHSTNFYATDTTGATIPAAIVPSDDGMSAWLFFTNPLASSASVAITVKGSTIKAADGSLLDAARNGTAGSTLTSTFTTVSDTAVPGTTISGIVADPGPDGQPGTRDDVRSGPDGILGTADDIYLNPIAGATVFILGQENQAVTSGANGSFTLSNIPAGDVKLVIDGNTATNAPSGVYYPEMVFDLTVQPGVANTVMGDMGTLQEQQAMGTALGAYLPRLQTSILQPAGGNTATTIALNPSAATSTLTTQQASEYSITVAPNSLVGMNGQKMSSGMVGVSTVSPSLIRDMLPQGVMQLATTLTIQAPGVATFSTPLQVTFANVYGAAPGTQLDVYSFNHTTGMLEITGTATVSQDGLTVTTDPGSGISHPGWFGVTPPGDCGGDGGPPPDNPPPNTENDLAPIVEPLITGEAGDFPTLTFTEDQAPPDPPPPPPPGCPPQQPTNQNTPYLEVTIEVDGPLDEFMNGTGSQPLASTSFDVYFGQTETFGATAQTYDEMFGGGLQNINSNILDGSKITITETQHNTDGSTDTTVQPYYLYRFIKATDTEPQNDTIFFEKTLDDGSVDRDKPLEVDTGGDSVPIIQPPSGDQFSLSGGGDQYTVTFTPTSDGVQTDSLDIQTPEGDDVGSINLQGTGVTEQEIDLNLPTLEAKFVDFSHNYDMYIPTTAATGTATISMGTTATATTSITMGAVTSVTIVSGGTNYQQPPTITISGGGGTGATGTAVLTHGVVTSVTITGGGTGYTSAPTVSFTAPGVVTGVTMTDGGGTYYMPPTVVFSGGGGTGAAGTAVLMGGAVTSVTITSPGSGYTTAPTVTFQDALKARFQAAVNADGGVGLANSIAARVESLYSAFDVVVTNTVDDANATVENHYLSVPAAGDPGGLLGESYNAPFNGVDLNAADLRNLFANIANYNQQQQGYVLDKDLNTAEAGDVKSILSTHVTTFMIDGVAAFVNNLADTIAHEDGHNIGLAHPWDYLNADHSINQAQPDLMGYAFDNAGTSAFTQTYSIPVLKIDLKAVWTPDDVKDAGAILLHDLNAGTFRTTTGGPDGDNSVFAPPAGGHVDIYSTTTGIVGSSYSFGSVAVDTSGHSPTTATFILTNYGRDPLTLNNLAITSGSAAFAVSGVAPGTVLQSGGTAQLTLSFDPTTAGSASANLQIVSNDPNSPINITLTGTGISASPSAHLALGDNNLGGVAVGATAQSPSLATITNFGAQPLVISAIQVEAGGSSFALTGVPANLATNPITLTTGQSFTFGAAYTAGQLGLQRAKIDVTTNDPNNSVVSFAVVGTGLARDIFPHWGNDYVAIEFPGLNDTVLRAVSDASGNFSFFIAPKQPYHLAIFDPITGLIANRYGVTPPSGQGLNLTSGLVFGPSTGPDNVYGALPTDIAFAVGTNPNVASTAGDGIDDFTHIIIDQTNALKGTHLTTGVIATLPLSGQALNVTLVGSTNSTGGQTAYVATGSYGLAIVNASNFQQPVLLGQIQLSGNSTSVAVDPQLQIAAVASGSGLNLINVSDPAHLQLLRNVSVAATAVTVYQGVAYAGGGNSVTAVDLLTGDQIAQESFSGGTINALSIDQGNLYVLVSGGFSSHTVYKVVLTGNSLPAPAYSLVITGHPTFGQMYMFAGGGYVYVGASDNNNFQEVPGVEVIQDTGTSLTYVGPSSAITAFNITVNSNGLGLYTGGLQFSSQVGLLDLSNPTITDNVVTVFNTPGTAESIAMGEGIGYVADGSGGLDVLNYLPFDTKGIAPTVSISLPPSAIVGTSGTTPEVVEGSTVPVLATATDDVQVRNVELLVNGQVVQNAVSFPFNLSTLLPSIAQAGNTATIQVLAYDTGGNVGASNILTLDLVPDTSPPRILSITPVNGSTIAEGVQSVQVTFNKALAAGTVTTANFQLTSAGTTITPTAIEQRNNGTLVELSYAPLLAGSYQFVINGPAVTDNVGHPLSTGNVTDSFTLTPRETLTVSNPNADPSSPGFHLYEGTTVHAAVSVNQSVTVQEVDLLLNGQLVASATAAPFTLSAVAPLLSAGATSFTLQARVTDASGVATLSSPFTVGLLRDTTPPSIVGTNPANGSTFNQGLPTITVTFSKSILESSVTTGNFQMFQAGPSGILGGPDQIPIPITALQFLMDDSEIQLTTAPLQAGLYQLVVTKDGITDRPGNALGTGTFTSSFTLVPQLIQNGGFETGDLTGWTFFPASSGSDFFVGSTPGFGPHSGSYAANFGAVSTSFDSISQTLGTIPGHSYILSYWLSHDSTNAENAFQVSWGGNVIQTLLNTSSFGWTSYTFTEMATTSSTVLQFSGYEIPAWFGLDDVSVLDNGQPQFFAGAAKAPAPDAPKLTPAQLQPVIATAIANLAAAGYNVESLGHVAFQLTTLPGSLLGLTNQNTIWIDQDAQGYGWYTDVSPSSNADFTQETGPNETQALPGSPAYGHVDLLTVVTHELGHVVGFVSIDPGILGLDWMTATLATGVRRAPDPVGQLAPASVPVTSPVRASVNLEDTGPSSNVPSAGTGQAGFADPLAGRDWVLPGSGSMLDNRAVLQVIDNSPAYSAALQFVWSQMADPDLPTIPVGSGGQDSLVGADGDDILTGATGPDAVNVAMVTKPGE